jgi:hypothetical protein
VLPLKEVAAIDHNEWLNFPWLYHIYSKVSMADFISSVVLLFSPLFRSCRIYNHHATAQPCAGMVSLIKLSVKRKGAQQNLALAPPAILVHDDEKFGKKEFSVSFQNAL